jgi:hypothetical protein
MTCKPMNYCINIETAARENPIEAIRRRSPKQGGAGLTAKEGEQAVRGPLTPASADTAYAAPLVDEDGRLGTVSGQAIRQVIDWLLIEYPDSPSVIHPLRILRQLEAIASEPHFIRKRFSAFDITLAANLGGDRLVDKNKIVEQAVSGEVSASQVFRAAAGGLAWMAHRASTSVIIDVILSEGSAEKPPKSIRLLVIEKPKDLHINDPDQQPYAIFRSDTTPNFESIERLLPDFMDRDSVRNFIDTDRWNRALKFAREEGDRITAQYNQIRNASKAIFGKAAEAGLTERLEELDDFAEKSTAKMTPFAKFQKKLPRFKLPKSLQKTVKKTVKKPAKRPSKKPAKAIEKTQPATASTPT